MKFGFILLVATVMGLNANSFAQSPSIDTAEIYTRLTTERLTEAQKLEILTSPLKTLSRGERIQYYSRVLSEMSKYKLSLSVEAALVDAAMKDAEQMPYVAPNPNGWESSLEALTRSLTEWASIHEADAPIASHDFFVRAFAMPGLTEVVLGHFSLFHTHWSDEKYNYPDYEFVMTNIIRSPRFNKFLATNDILDGINIKQPWTTSSDIQTYKPPYAVQARVMEELILSDKLPPSAVPFAKDIAYKLNVSSQFLKNMKQVPQDEYQWKRSRNLALKIINSGKNAPYLPQVMIEWFLHASVPQDLQTDLVSKLLKKSEAIFQTEDISYQMVFDALDGMRHFLVFSDLPEQVQREVSAFVIRHSALPTEAAEHLRFSFLYQFIYEHKNTFKPLKSTQWVMELIAEKSLVAVPKTRENPNRADSDDVIAMALVTLESCQKSDTDKAGAGFDPRVCQVITSPLAIYQKIVGNKNISEAMRKRASDLGLGSK